MVFQAPGLPPGIPGLPEGFTFFFFKVFQIFVKFHHQRNRKVYIPMCGIYVWDV